MGTLGIDWAINVKEVVKPKVVGMLGFLTEGGLPFILMFDHFGGLKKKNILFYFFIFVTFLDHLQVSNNKHFEKKSQLCSNVLHTLGLCSLSVS